MTRNHSRNLCIIGRAGASPPSRTTGLNFLYIYIYIYMTIHIAHARAKRKAGSFQVQRSHVPSKLSRVVSSLSTTNHPCAWTVPTSAERLSVWKSPQETTTLCVFYSESYAHIAIQRPCCPPVNSLLNVLCTIYCHKTRQGMWLLSHNQWGRSRSPKMRGIALVYVYWAYLV